MKKIALAATGLTLGLAACGASPQATSGGVQQAAAPITQGNELIDFDDSVSATNPQSNLVAVAQQTVASRLAALTPGYRITVVGFNNRPGTACTPLVFDYVNASSGEEEDQMDTMQAGLPDAFAGYQACLTGAYGSNGTKGSEIFGAIPTGIIAAQASTYPLTGITVVTDGCAVGEGIRTCDPEQMQQDGFPQQVIDALPESLKPDLSGISLTVVGLGAGKHLNADQIDILRDIWRIYAQATHAAGVTFQ